MTEIELIATARRYPALWNTGGRRIFGAGWTPIAPIYHANDRRLYPVTIGSIIVDDEIPYRVVEVNGALGRDVAGRLAWRYIAHCVPLSESAADYPGVESHRSTGRRDAGARAGPSAALGAPPHGRRTFAAPLPLEDDYAFR